MLINRHEKSEKTFFSLSKNVKDRGKKEELSLFAENFQGYPSFFLSFHSSSGRWLVELPRIRLEIPGFNHGQKETTIESRSDDIFLGTKENYGYFSFIRSWVAEKTERFIIRKIEMSSRVGLVSAFKAESGKDWSFFPFFSLCEKSPIVSFRPFFSRSNSLLRNPYTHANNFSFFRDYWIFFSSARHSIRSNFPPSLHG